MSKDVYEWWIKALAGEGMELHADDPQPGFYRIRRGKAWIPVGIWWDEDSTVADGAALISLVGFSDSARECDPLETWDTNSSNPMSIWLVAAKHPVSEEAYRAAFDTGRWPDDAPEANRGIGDNLPEEPVDQIKVELEGEAEIVAQFLTEPVKTQEEADRVGPWVDRLRKLAQRADKIREEEKAPFLQGCRDVDDKWRVPVAKARELAKRLLQHLKPFLDEQDRLRREAALAAAIESDRLRKEADKQTSEAERADLQRKASDAAQRSVVQNPSAGRTGATVSLRHEKAAEITDYDALLTALKDRPEIKEVVQSLARRAAKAGIELPGMKIIEITKAA